ncbi:aminomethyl transferase family protein [Rubrobacter taiwanensis]|jgi:vanillate/3-O-methylgallate O-demethylase|uniref:Aminomethyl transferase family protein n=1 Tax=Rubrobacter taiwanensis TaxID=185139 RepID=A0A4R1BA91_9ACTN|nr:aminomethyltransferase family protein [Rubrobacter taiwanensis]TCJ13871.1 aminomethyl transferase family protein [Rubrobacter taiwanensis]
MRRERKSLEDLLGEVSGPVEILYNSQTGPRVFPGVPAEFSNWREEQRGWRESCVLLDQSHHMTDLYIEGPDALRLLSELGVNSFEGFTPDKAKQFVACNHEGYVIGDMILYYLDENRLDLVGRPAVPNWVQYWAETGGYDVTFERDENSAVRKGPPKVYRYQVQGPRALSLMREVVEGDLPEVKFFNTAGVVIGGCGVRALRHGMAGQAGYELSGPWEDAEAVREAILEAGEKFGLKQAGSLAYQTATSESGWIPCPLPAVYTGEKMKPYREWLPADGYEATASLGGSFYSEDITDYYLTPYDLGYGHMVKFDHDFVGREALEEMSGNPGRKKVTLVWDGEDVARVFGTLFEREALPAKYINMPSAWYAVHQYDRVLSGGESVGISTYCGYSYNERAMLSLAMVEEEVAEPGTEVVLLWGEEPNSSKPQVEEHRQVEIRATVAPAPLVEFARTAYRSS